MGMDLRAILGYGVQLNVFEENPICDMELAEELYWNDKQIRLEFGGYEGTEAFLMYKPSIISSSDWTPEAYDKLPKLDTIADQALRKACNKLEITQEFKWWLVPYYG